MVSNINLHPYTEFDGAISADKLDALNTHLLTRSFLVGHGVTIADLVVYAAVQGAVAALSAEKKAAACNLVRWCDFMQAACGGKAVFGEVAVAHAEFPVFVAADPAPAAKDAKSGAGSAPKGGEGKGKGGDAKSEASGAEKGGKDKKKGGGGEQAAESKGKGKEGGAAAAAAAEGGKDKKAEKAEKKEKKPKELPVKKEIDVSVLDIRVGTILKCWEHPGADKLWVEEIDLGEGKPRQVCSGLRDFVPKERMEGARVVVLCNVKPGNMRDERSEAMVMCASNDDHTKVDFVVPPEGVPNGEKVTFEGFDGEPEAVLNPKKKQFDACQPKLMTNDKGVACYDNVPFMTTKGPCTSPLATSHIK